MLYVGLDVHARKIVGCILNAEGKRMKEFSIGGDAGLLLAELGRLKERCRVCYEASCGYGFLFDQLAKLSNVERIVVAHPGKHCSRSISNANSASPGARRML